MWGEAAAWESDLERSRPQRPLIDMALSFYERDRASLGALLSGALAFRMFVWSVPFALALVTVVGLLVRGDGNLFDHLAIGGELAESLSEVGRERWTSQVWALGIGLVGSVWTSRGLLRALRLTHATVWGLGRVRPRVNPLRAALALIGLITSVIAILGVAAWLRGSEPVFGMVVTLGVVVVLACIWLVVSHRLPHPADLPVRALVPGAVLFAVGFQLMHLLTVFLLVPQADRAQSVYGAIGVAVVLLLWFFLLARLIASAAVLNAVLWEHERAGKVGLRVLGFRMFGRRPGDRPVPAEPSTEHRPAPPS